MITRVLTLCGFASTALLSCCLQACSGRSIDLDQTSGTVSAGASGDDTVLLNLKATNPIFSDILVDDTRLYWINGNGDLQSCVKDNCAHSVITYASVLANGDQWSPEIAVGGGYVYWFSNDNTLYSCPSTGCGKAPTKVIQDSNLPGYDSNQLAADAGYVYWVSALDLYRCAPTGCGAAPEIVAAERSSSPTYSRDNAYWVNSDPNDNGVFSSDSKNTLRTAPKDGSAPPTTVLTDSVAWVAADETNVYWTNFSNHVLRCPVSGCAGLPAGVDGSDTPKGYLTLDDSGLYWQEDPLNSGAVHFCPLDDCGSEATLTPAGVQSFAVDSQYLYWVEGTFGSGGIAIHRVAR
jgi:hypothetical protein